MFTKLDSIYQNNSDWIYKLSNEALTSLQKDKLYTYIHINLYLNIENISNFLKNNKKYIEKLDDKGIIETMNKPFTKWGKGDLTHVALRMHPDKMGGQGTVKLSKAFV